MTSPGETSTAWIFARSTYSVVTLLFTTANHSAQVVFQGSELSSCYTGYGISCVMVVLICGIKATRCCQVQHRITVPNTIVYSNVAIFLLCRVRSCRKVFVRTNPSSKDAPPHLRASKQQIRVAIETSETYLKIVRWYGNDRSICNFPFILLHRRRCSVNLTYMSPRVVSDCITTAYSQSCVMAG